MQHIIIGTDFNRSMISFVFQSIHNNFCPIAFLLAAQTKTARKFNAPQASSTKIEATAPNQPIASSLSYLSSRVEIGEKISGKMRWQVQPDWPLRRIGSQNSFFQQLCQDNTPRTYCHSRNTKQVPASNFAAKQNLLQHICGFRLERTNFLGRARYHLSFTHDHVATDTVKQIVHAQKATHKCNLIKTGLEKKSAKFDQFFVGKISPAIQIIAPQRIRCPQGIHIFFSLPCQAATDVPQPISLHRKTKEAGICIEPCHSAVTVKKRMDPHQPVMRSCGGDERFQPMMLAGRVSIGETVKKCGKMIR